MNELVLRNVLDAFLKSEHGLTLSDAEFPAIQGVPEVQLALEFFEKRFADSAPLEAIISQVSETAAIYEVERKQLYAMLKSALSFNPHTRNFGAFNERAAQISLNRTRDLKNPTELRLMHGGLRNAGLQEKFLRNHLHGQEWLSDLDLKRLLTTMGLQNTITVTRLDALDIGMALHFARSQHGASVAPYAVRLLLNKGEEGNYKSQGSHWMEVVLTVTPGVPAQVEVNFSDSLVVSDAEKARVFAIIDAGIAFREEVPLDRSKDMVAFPEATVIHREPEIGGQHDAWSCGYRALAKSLSHIPVAEQGPTAQSIVAALGDGVTELRDRVYELSLAHLEVPLAAMPSIAATFPDQADIFESSAEVSTLKKKFLAGYLKAVSTTHAHTRTTALTNLKDLQEKILLDEKIAAFKKIAQEQLQVKDGVVTLDVTKLFTGIAKDSPDEKAMILALVAHLNEAHATVLTIVNVSDEMFSAEHIELFYQLAFAKEIILAAEKSPIFKDVLQKVAARNKLMEFLKIEIDPEEDIGQQLYAARVANPGLFYDNSAATGELGIFSANNTPDATKLNYSIFKSPKQYFQSLLNFLEDNKKFLSENPDRFLYQKFCVADYLPFDRASSNEYADKTIVENLAVDSLRLLAEHLEAKKYFPFNALEILVEHTEGAYFEQLKRVFRALKNYPAVLNMRIRLGRDSIGRSDEDFSVEQYEELKRIFAEEKLCIDLDLKLLYGDEKNLQDPVVCARYDLLNDVAQHRRIAAIAKRQGQFSAHVTQEESEDFVSASTEKKGSVRACKLAGFNVRQNLALDISLEQQAEQQHQAQTTLQQDVQQALEVQAQEQAEVMVAHGDFSAATLISKESFIEADYRQLMQGASQQKQDVLLNTLIDEIEREKAWDSLMGTGGLPHHVSYMTPQAFAMVAGFPQFFLNGFNIDNLPAGFFIQKMETEEAHVLCYDPLHYKENKNQSPLTLRLVSKPPTEKTWMGDYRQFNPDEKDNDKVFNFNGMKASPRDAKRQDLFSFMQILNAELATEIITKHAWCFTSQAGSMEDFAQGREIYLLIDLVYHEGCEGLMVFLDALKVMRDADSSLYQHFKKYVLCFNRDTLKRSVMDMMTEKNLEIIKKLTELTPVQKTWWKKIVELQIGVNEGSGTQYADLGVLYDGFLYFLKKIPHTVTLPPTCPLTGENPLLQLDRLLTCLSKVKPAHLQDQLDHLSGLDFGMEGAWYAARFNGFHFFHESMSLKPVVNEFGETEPQQDFKVDYAGLVAACEEAAQDSDFEKGFAAAKVAFYRYVGQSKNIALPYEYYLARMTQLAEWTPKEQGPRLGRLKRRPGVRDISQLQREEDDYEHDSLKFKLLPVLAIATTGPRGAKASGPVDFVKFLDEIDREKLEDVLPLLTERLNQLEHKPNLSELVSLMRLLVESDNAEQAADVLLDSKNSEQQLSALELWGANEHHLSADQFVRFYQAIKDGDAEHLDYLSRMAALIKSTGDEIDLSALTQALLALQDRPDYNVVLKLLANIDLAETTADHLPTFIDLLRVLGQLQAQAPKSANETYRYLLTELPGVKFNRAATLDATPANFSEQLLAQIEVFNAELEKYSLASWDMAIIQSSGAVDYLTEQYVELYSVTLPRIIEEKGVTGVFKSLAVSTAQAAVRLKVKDFLQGAFLAPLAGFIDEFKALGQLKSEYGTEPSVSGNPDTFKTELTALAHYTTVMENLFEVLVELKKQFGDAFNLDFLLNSPVLQNYSQESLARIFISLRDQGLGFIPTSLLTAIFNHPHFEEGADTDALSAHIAEIIAMDKLSVKQRAMLVTTLYQHTDKIDELPLLVKNLTYAKTHFSNVESVLFELSLKVLDAKHSKTILEGMQDLLSAFKQEGKAAIDPACLIILRYFLENDNGMRAFYELIIGLTENIHNLEKHNAKAVLTIFAYSIFKNDSYDSDLLKNAITALGDLSSEKFTQIASLYDKPPRPSSSVLQKLLDDELSVADYEKDPYGDRVNAMKLAQQFSIDTVHDRVDAITDLGRRVDVHAPAPALFYTHRQKLYDGIAYVSAVGHAHSLSLDAAHQACVRPVMNLTHAEIKSLLLHYRMIISNPDASPADVWLAQLETLALVREALYRTQGKMAYDTQLLSVLNLMLHGGNVFSEIRTGEGKSIITAMMAVMKWMEGGAVDVCSSNMSLAARDLEENGDFFEYLGIKTSLIRASSAHGVYQQEGINYSDISELSLFQEQQLLLGETLAEKASLVLDEVDFNVLDNTTQFRFATSLDKDFDPHFNPYQDLYIHVIHFVQRDNFLREKCSAKQDIVNLRNYIRGLPDNILAASKKAKFLGLSDEWLDRWIDAAYTATHLREDEDYVIRDAMVVKNEEEVEISQGQVKINFRANPNSRFSDGVHQFLHALLNERMEKDSEFKRKRHDKPFVIEPEKTYLASRSAKNTIDYYLRPDAQGQKRGDVIGLTGTIGTYQDCAELSENYAAKFFRIPPHKALRRESLPPLVAKRQGFFKKETAQEAHFREILKDIKAAQKRGQCVLVICDGVQSSEKLYAFLDKHLVAADQLQLQLQLHNGEQIGQTDEEVTQKAGIAGMVTVSTPMFGRGTDIKPKTAAGLHVTVTSMADEREYGQNVGRAGRNGAIGSDRLVLSEDVFTSRDKKIPSAANLAASIQEIRDELASTQRSTRYEKQAFSDVKDQFFKQYTEFCRGLKADIRESFAAISRDDRSLWNEISREQHIQWEAFLKFLDADWSVRMTSLANAVDEFKKQQAQLITSDPKLSKKEKDKKLSELDSLVADKKTELLKQHLQEHTQKANQKWQSTCAAMLAKANFAYQTAYAKVAPASQAASGSSDGTIDAPLVAPAKILAYTPQVVQASLSAVPSAPMKLDFVMSAQRVAVPSQPSVQKPLESYVALSKNDTTAEKQRVLMFKLNVTQEIHINSRIEACAKEFLRSAYDVAHRGWDASYFMRDFALFCKTVATYGNDPQKQTLRAVVDEHIKTVSADKSYDRRGAYLLNIDGLAQKAGIVSVPAARPSVASVANTSWAQTYALAKKLIQHDYLDRWFMWRSSDRKDVAKGLMDLLEELNGNASLTEQEKFLRLSRALDNASHAMLQDDLVADQEAKTSWFARYRNEKAEGSRLQTAVQKVRDFMTAVDPAPESRAGLQIEVKKLIKQLNARAKEFDLKIYKNIATENLSNKFTLKNYEHYTVIYDTLKKLRHELSTTQDHLGFRNQLDVTLAQLELWLLQASKKVDIKTELQQQPKFKFREALQNSLSQLLKIETKDTLHPKPHPLSTAGIHVALRYADALKTLPAEHHSLLAKGLFEIERLLQMTYPQLMSIQFANVCYENSRLTVGIVLNDDKHLSLSINEFRMGGNVVCERLVDPAARESVSADETSSEGSKASVSTDKIGVKDPLGFLDTDEFWRDKQELLQPGQRRPFTVSEPASGSRSFSWATSPGEGIDRPENDLREPLLPSKKPQSKA